MLFFDGALGLVVFALWIFCIIDVITTPDGSVRNLPKIIWLFVVIGLFDIGAILWLVAGRDWNRGTSGLPYKGNRGMQPAAPEWVRRGLPGQASGARRGTAPPRPRGERRTRYRRHVGLDDTSAA
jgi:hypothetical protein